MKTCTASTFRLLLATAVISAALIVRPKIFVYDLPEKWHDEAKYGNEINAPSCFYSVDKLFPELLRASPYHTKNATEADFFYVGCMEADSHACWPLLRRHASMSAPTGRWALPATPLILTYLCRLRHGCTGDGST